MEAGTVAVKFELVAFVVHLHAHVLDLALARRHLGHLLVVARAARLGHRGLDAPLRRGALALDCGRHPLLVLLFLLRVLEVLVEVPHVVRERLVLEHDDLLRDSVKEGAVVRDGDDRRVRELGKVVLQPHDRRQVEVVRRLVQKEHVGLDEQRRRKSHADAPAPRELAQRPVVPFARKA